MVGDTDQTIYRFRGSHEQILQKFVSDFPECAQYSLTTNYRNTHTILEAAKAVIAHNPREKPKELRAQSNNSSPISLLSFASQKEEAAWIAKDIKELQRREPSWYIGILYRHHHQEEALLQALHREGVKISLLSSHVSSFVQLSTLHGAKGLEYDAVYWPGFQEGIFPSPYARTQRETEEERRLCYVGFTRARFHLTLTHTGRSSPFLQDIPHELLSSTKY